MGKRKNKKNVSVNNTVETNEEVSVSMSREVAEELKQRFMGTTEHSGNENMPEMDLDQMEEEVKVFAAVKAEIEANPKVRKLLNTMCAEHSVLVVTATTILGSTMDSKDSFVDTDEKEDLVQARMLFAMRGAGIEIVDDNTAMLEKMGREMAYGMISKSVEMKEIVTNIADTKTGKLIAWILTGKLELTKDVRKMFKRMMKSDQALELKETLELVEKRAKAGDFDSTDDFKASVDEFAKSFAKGYGEALDEVVETKVIGKGATEVIDCEEVSTDGETFFLAVTEAQEKEDHVLVNRSTVKPVEATTITLNKVRAKLAAFTFSA